MALEKNFTLKVMPVSVIDAANAIKLQVQYLPRVPSLVPSLLLPVPFLPP